jgi:hypothetical protein
MHYQQTNIIQVLLIKQDKKFIGKVNIIEVNIIEVTIYAISVAVY